jgi:hypothetical protein
MNESYRNNIEETEDNGENQNTYDDLAQEVPFAENNQNPNEGEGSLTDVLNKVNEQYNREIQNEDRELLAEARTAIAEDYNILAKMVTPHFGNEQEREYFERRAGMLGLESANVGVVDYLIEQEERLEDLNSTIKSLQDTVNQTSSLSFFRKRNHSKMLESAQEERRNVFRQMERFLPETSQGQHGYAQFFASALKSESALTGDNEVVPALSIVDDIKIQRKFIRRMEDGQSGGRNYQITQENARVSLYGIKNNLPPYNQQN